MSAAPSALLSAVRAQSRALNLRPLQRIDPLIQSVLWTGKHTVLYRLDRHSEQWERDNVEGPFFVVERSAAPLYQLVILNRLGLEAWLLPLLADTRFELQEGHYLFIQSGADVVGVWFYEPSDAQQAADTLQQLTRASSANQQHEQHEQYEQHERHEQYEQYEQNEQHNTPPQHTNATTAGATIPGLTFPAQPSNSSSQQQQQPRRAGHPIVVPAGRRLHSQPPPPPTLPLSSAVDGASEAELQSRLSSFLGAFKEEDEAYAEAHREALLQQSAHQPMKGSTAAPTATPAQPPTAANLSPTQNGIPLPLDALFRSVAAGGGSSRPATPSAVDATELERSLAANRSTQHSDAETHSTPAVAAAAGGLHPLVSQLFQQSADSRQQLQPLHRHTAPPAQLSVPSSLSSHTQPPTPLLTPAQLAAVPLPLATSHNSGALQPPIFMFSITLSSLPAALPQSAFIHHVRQALSDERIVDDLYEQYEGQQQQQQQRQQAVRNTANHNNVRLQHYL